MKAYIIVMVVCVFVYKEKQQLIENLNMMYIVYKLNNYKNEIKKYVNIITHIMSYIW